MRGGCSACVSFEGEREGDGEGDGERAGKDKGTACVVGAAAATPREWSGMELMGVEWNGVEWS
jgi:hypothetical protein